LLATLVLAILLVTFLTLAPRLLRLLAGLLAATLLLTGLLVRIRSALLLLAGLRILRLVRILLRHRDAPEWMVVPYKKQMPAMVRSPTLRCVLRPLRGRNCANSWRRIPACSAQIEFATAARFRAIKPACRRGRDRRGPRPA